MPEEPYMPTVLTAASLLPALIGQLPPPDAAVPNVDAVVALPFPLESVRLEEGPFKHAMELDGRWLLALEPDRLLARFRSEAGLEPKAESYGAWESEGVAGHTLGHYLTACAKMYASTGDERFGDRTAYIVDELRECQRANGDGYVAAIPDGRRAFAEIRAGDIRSAGFDLNGIWVPWYTLHKQFAGLLDTHRHCGNELALQVAIELADWAYQLTADLTHDQWQTMLACEHGGINESFAELYAVTGEERYLELSRKFHHEAVLEPLAEGEDPLPGLHGNTQIPKIIGVARRYELTGDERDRAIAESFWSTVVDHHSYVTGGNTTSEHFGPPDQLSNRLGNSTTETCNTYNMLKLTRHLMAWDPSARHADYYERALYNHILASQNPDTGMVCYYVPLEPGSHKTYSTIDDSFWCCVGTGIENHAKYGESIYYHSGDTLYVNLFIASTLNWNERGLTLRQATDFPYEEATTLTLDLAEPTEVSLAVRKPSWVGDGFAIEVNGEEAPAQVRDGYAHIRRQWEDGDTVRVRLPMELRLEPMPDDADRVAILYGPLVLAGLLGPEDDPRATEMDYVPVLVPGDRDLAEWIVAGDEPLTFHLRGAGHPRNVLLKPFHQVHGERYTVYWDRFSPEGWERRQAEYREERRRQKVLEAITVDWMQPGEMQDERDHNVQGENTGVGEHLGRKFRHGFDGGWFSFEMAVDPSGPLDLICTYWGSDVGARTFDIVVDGQVVATQTLDMDAPDEFFQVTYPLPGDLIENKDRVTVELRGHEGNFAGGLFGVRVVRRTGPAPDPPEPYGALPSDRQLDWHDLELYGFLHFTVNTFTDKEWGFGDESPSIFEPTDFDADQMARVAAEGGLKGLILTAKHHDGFCLWPSAYTDHSVAASPWRDGEGDVVREVAEACRRHGLEFGVYLSPWDRNHPDYGSPAYVEYYRNQLRELLTEYGEIFEVWFDGANGGDGYYGGANETRHVDKHGYYGWDETWGLIRELQPGAVIFSDIGPDVRWVGNESGVAGDPCWATITPEGTVGEIDIPRNTSGERGGSEWIPAEADVSIRPGWFYHPAEDDDVKTPQQLVDLYYASIGRGASLLLNLPPDRRGQIHETDAASLVEFGRIIEETFDENLAAGAELTASDVRGDHPAYGPETLLDGDRDTYWATDDGATAPELVLDLGQPTTFNVVSLREHLPLGQRIQTIAVDVWEGGQWREIAAVTGIGARRLIRLEPTTTERVRVRVVESPVCPALSELGLYLEPGE
jgi:hypothetical protein